MVFFFIWSTFGLGRAEYLAMDRTLKTKYQSTLRKGSQVASCLQPLFRISAPVYYNGLIILEQTWWACSQQRQRSVSGFRSVDLDGSSEVLGFLLCPSFGILKTRKHSVSETGSVSVLI
jgi:hypothetical protein